MKLFCEAFYIRPSGEALSKLLKSNKLQFLYIYVETEVCSEIRYIHIPMNGIPVFQDLGIRSIKNHYAISTRK